jgi:hypothetical protein
MPPEKVDRNPPVICATCGREPIVAVGIKGPHGGYFLCRGCYIDPKLEVKKSR